VDDKAKCPTCRQDDVKSFGREYPKRRWLHEQRDPLTYKAMFQCHICHYRWKSEEKELHKR